MNTGLKSVLENVVRPAFTRLGSLAAGGLIQYGIATEHANAIALGGVSLMLVGIDLMLAYVTKKVVQRQAVAKAMANGL